MADIKLTAEQRDQHGSSASRRLRASGRVPAIVYGHGTDPVSISVNSRELRHALASEAGINALLDISIGKDRYLALTRAVQHHPVRHTLSHVDFQIVGRDEVVTADVAIEIVGDPVAVNRHDGTVEHLLTSILVKAKPADIPSSIVVDVSDLEVGSMILVSDLTEIPGVSFEVEADTPLVIAHPPREVAVEAEAEIIPGSEDPV